MTTEMDGSASPASGRRLLVFQSGDQRYGLFSNDIERITPMAELERPPGSPPLLAGFLNVAGDLIPVVCLASLRGQPPAPIGLWTPLIIVRVSGQRLGLLVDRLHVVMRVDEDAAVALPPGRILNDCVKGIVRWGDDSVLVFAPERLLLEQESQSLAELQRQARRRLSELETVQE